MIIPQIFDDFEVDIDERPTKNIPSTIRKIEDI
jgi:hypothetical protein